ncbi:RCKP-type rubredoxin-like domain-containing protein [Acididesulfobacillus acetoxydans]|uniref:RCKP-type rubredoxin-like domain-containing protein n=1 Tax=Acididesulfobacillus acetoxydans TaxID=1561005 RepID=UPI0030B8385D
MVGGRSAVQEKMNPDICRAAQGREKVMATWKCSECGATSEGRCRPKTCKNCGADKEKIVKAES